MPYIKVEQCVVALDAIKRDMEDNEKDLRELRDLKSEISGYEYDEVGDGQNMPWKQSVISVLTSERALAEKVGLESRVNEIDKMLNHYHTTKKRLEVLKNKYDVLAGFIKKLESDIDINNGFEDMWYDSDHRIKFHFLKILNVMLDHPDSFKNSFGAKVPEWIRNTVKIMGWG